MSAVYFEFELDGFHNRTLDGWREVVRRVECPAYMTKAQQIGNRRIKPYLMPASALVERSEWRATAKKHAAAHGSAGVWHADDSLTLFYRDGDKIRTKRFPHAKPARQ